MLLPRKHVRSTLSTSSSNSGPTKTPFFKINCFSLSFVCERVRALFFDFGGFERRERLGNWVYRDRNLEGTRDGEIT